MERLPAAARAELTAEILGERPSQLALHLRQMDEFDVFGAVASAVQAEIAAAQAALAPYASEPPAPLLLGLCDVLQAQVTSLRP